MRTMMKPIYVKLPLKRIKHLNHHTKFQHSIILNILRHSSHFILRNSHPKWSGFISKVSWNNISALDNYPFSILDLIPYDMTYIYSAWLIGQNLSRHLGIPTLVITFNPLLRLMHMIKILWSFLKIYEGSGSLTCA